MPKNNYFFVDPSTGEVLSLESSVNITVLEEYNAWVIESKLNPPTYSPIEFAQYFETKKTLENVQRVLDFIEQYNHGTSFHPDMIDTIERMLRDEE